MDLITDWYDLDSENSERNHEIIAALKFISASPYVEEAMIEARDNLHAAILACEYKAPTDEEKDAEKALLDAHMEARRVISLESISAIDEQVDSVSAGEYLYEYDLGTCEATSMPYTLGDDQCDALQARLGQRGLEFTTDSQGWLVRDVE